MAETTKSQISELKIAAISYCKLEDYSKAEKAIRKALELKSDSKNLHHELAKIFLKSMHISKLKAFSDLGRFKVIIPVLLFSLKFIHSDI